MGVVGMLWRLWGRRPSSTRYWEESVSELRALSTADARAWFEKALVEFHLYDLTRAVEPRPANAHASSLGPVSSELFGSFDAIHARGDGLRLAYTELRPLAGNPQFLVLGDSVDGGSIVQRNDSDTVADVSYPAELEESETVYLPSVYHLLVLNALVEDSAFCDAFRSRHKGAGTT